eukprot:5529682-Amphidinium_carterae.1
MEPLTSPSATCFNDFSSSRVTGRNLDSSSYAALWPKVSSIRPLNSNLRTKHLLSRNPPSPRILQKTLRSTIAT